MSDTPTVITHRTLCSDRESGAFSNTPLDTTKRKTVVNIGCEESRAYDKYFEDAIYGKLQEEQLEDGWTRVIRGELMPADHGYDVGVSEIQLAPEEAGLTIARLTKTFDSYMQKWVASEAKRSVDRIIETRVFVEDVHDRHFTTGVLLALGSVARSSHEGQARSMWQLVCFIDMVKTIQARTGRDMSLYAQEPRFSPLDIAFLQKLKFTVLEDHAALPKIHPHTFLMVPCLEWHIETPYRENAAACSLYVSSKMEWVIEQAEISIERNKKLAITPGAQRGLDSAKVIQQRHHAYEFPDFEHTGALSMTIHVKKSAFEDEEEQDNDDTKEANPPANPAPQDKETPSTSS